MLPKQSKFFFLDHPKYQNYHIIISLQCKLILVELLIILLILIHETTVLQGKFGKLKLYIMNRGGKYIF